MSEQLYDVIVIGGGPAGLTAGIYLSRARIKTLLIESMSLTSQVGLTFHIENYPGFLEGVTGFDLLEKFKKQALFFGTEIITDNVKQIKTKDKGTQTIWEITTENTIYESLAVIIATGARYKKLDIPGENKFQGRGVSYCAVCDAAFFKDKTIAVIGGGDTAIEEALFLTKFAKKIYLVHRRHELRAVKLLQERILVHPKIEFIWDSVLEEIMGESQVKGIHIKNLKNNTIQTIDLDGVFIFIGLIPNTDFLHQIVKLNQGGYIITDNNMKTNQEGLYAAGDCRDKTLRQIVNACGDGAVAAYSAQHYVENLKGIEYK